ncbi:Imm59 family immunity protein [Enterococcus sp. LJL51]|uniref:Imm59 family immunity protein n=1 Tax=Enterococcus sp. LJL51 TaxID=3416656 RepID=UPI003CEF7126
MTEEKAKEIIRTENLANFVMFENKHIGENKTVITKKSDIWEVFVTNERAVKSGVREYDNESDALEDFIERLKINKQLEEYFNR